MISQVLFVGCALLALVTIVSARHEQRASAAAGYGWLVAALGAFVIVVIPVEPLGYDYYAADHAYWLRFAPLSLVVFPGLLARAICALCGINGRWLRASDALTVLLAITVLVMQTFPGARFETLPLTYQLLAAGLVVEILLSDYVGMRAARRASRCQPHVVVTRAGLLIGTQLAFSLVMLGWLAAPSQATAIASNVILLTSGMLLLLVLRWPHRIVHMFGQKRSDRWLSIGVLMGSTNVRHDLEGILHDIAQDAGFVGIATVDRDGRVVELLGRGDLTSPASRVMREVRISASGTTIIAWTTALSLPLTRTDRKFLTLMATLIQFALDREATAGDQAEAARSLYAANARLLEADQMKDQFVSLVSHELRTPLTAIIGLAQTAEQRWDDLSEAQLREFQHVIVEQGQRLARIIENLLLTSRIEARVVGKVREPVDLPSLTATAIRDAGVSTTDTYVIIDEDARNLISDSQVLQDILINYLANAQKYGKPPFEIHAHRSGDMCEIDVQDAGEGVDPEFSGRLFERFARAPNLAQPGTGLGLAIVRDLALAIDGEAGYRPAHPGSVFWVRVPADETPHETLV